MHIFDGDDRASVRSEIASVLNVDEETAAEEEKEQSVAAWCCDFASCISSLWSRSSIRLVFKAR